MRIDCKHVWEHISAYIDGEVDAVHPPAAFQQEPVEARMILVGLPAEERLDVQAVRPGDEPGHGRELVLALQPHEVGARPRRRERKPEAAERRLDFSGCVRGLPVLHQASTA